MRRLGALLTVPVVLVAAAGLVFYTKVGWLIGGVEQVDPRIEYCFDVATDSAGDRLFVAAGRAGLHILEVEDGRLEHASTYYDEGYYRNLKVWQDRAYIADSERGLVVVDIGGERPTTVWVQPEGEAAGIEIKDGRAYVAAYARGLQVFDLSDPDAPMLLGETPTAGHAWDVWVSADIAYVADFNSGLSVVDISVPSQPRHMGLVTWAKRYQTAEIVRGSGDTVYVAASKLGLIIIDVADPAKPVVASRYRPTRIGMVEGLAVRNGTVYLSVRGRIKLGRGEDALVLPTVENGLHIVNTQNPSAPSVLGKLSFPGMVEGVHVVGNIAYVANAFLGARSIDVGDPVEPVLLDTFRELPVNAHG
jgi:hypothetical protein